MSALITSVIGELGYVQDAKGIALYLWRDQLADALTELNVTAIANGAKIDVSCQSTTATVTFDTLSNWLSAQSGHVDVRKAAHDLATVTVRVYRDTGTANMLTGAVRYPSRFQFLHNLASALRANQLSAPAQRSALDALEQARTADSVLLAELNVSQFDWPKERP